MADTLKISIITINYNDVAGLKKTMQSVLEQSYTAIEYIVIDGGSKDGSKAYIEENNDRLAYWVSEPDKGIYHAMNKGIDKATGEYLLFLNSGDCLIENNTVESFVSINVSDDIVYGKIKWKKGEEIWDGDYSKKITFKYFSKASLPHQGSFIKRKLFKKVGKYDESLRIVSDWKFFVLAIYKYHCSFRRLNLFISVCNRDGLSCLPESWPLILKERANTLQEYFPAFYADLEVYEKNENKLKDKIKTLKKNQPSRFCRLINKITR